MEPMSLVAWIVVGLVAGWLASQVIPSRMGIIGDTVIGMLGALAGGFLFNEFGESGATGLNIYSIFVAFIGAVILLFVINLLTKRQGLSTR